MRTHPTSAVDLKEEHLADLVARACNDDDTAWHALWMAIAPRIESVAGRWRVLGRLAQSEDARGDVVDCVMGKLRQDGRKLLHHLGELLARRDGSYRRWLAGGAEEADRLKQSAVKLIRRLVAKEERRSSIAPPPSSRRQGARARRGPASIRTRAKGTAAARPGRTGPGGRK